MGEAKDQNVLIAELITKLYADPGTPVPNPTVAFWQEPSLPFADKQSKTLPQTADVVIIGSGITAVSTAQHLLRLDESLKIVILEARQAVSGATGRNGGHFRSSPLTDHAGLKEYLGTESAIKVTKFRLAHYDAYMKETELLGEAGKAGKARRVDGYTAFYHQPTFEKAKLAREVFLQDFPEERERYTVHEGEAESKEMGFVNAVGCFNGPAGAIWPYRFVGAVLSKLLDTGNVSLETHTPATGVERSDSSTHPYRVQTARGEIATKHVIHCTNAFAAHLLPALRGKLWPMRGQMTVQSVPDNFPRVGATRSWIASFETGFDYITQSPDADGSLYLGGGILQDGLERDRDLGNTDDSEQSAQCLERLAEAAGQVFVHGQGAKIEKKWTGVMGFTGDDMPYVGRVKTFLSGREEVDTAVGGEWIAAGFNGNGMVSCWLSGKGLASMVTGREAETLDWFPRDEFAASEKRVQSLSPEVAIANFFGS